MISPTAKAKSIGTVFEWLADLSAPLFFLHFFYSSFPNTFQLLGQLSEAASPGG